MDCTDMGGVGGMMGWMLLWAVLALVLLALVIFGAVWAARRLSGPGNQSPVESAQEQLERRYAAGEIDDEEFLRRRTHLRERGAR